MDPDKRQVHRRAILPFLSAAAVPSLAQAAPGANPIIDSAAYFHNRATAMAARIPRSQPAILLAGYAAPGDGQELLTYRQTAKPPPHNLFIQSADGTIWEYTPGPNGANAVAAGLDQSSPNNAAAWRELRRFVSQYGSSLKGIESHFLDIFVPSGVYQFSEGITWDPGHGGVTGYGAHFRFGNDGLDIESSNPEDNTNYRNHRAVLRGISIFGSGKGSGLRFTPKTHETAHVTVRDTNVGGFDTGVEFSANAHTITLDSCAIYFNNHGLRDNGARDNSGENIRCVNSEIFNNAVTGFKMANSNATYSFIGCSIDYNGMGKGGESQFDTDVGQFRYTDCHIEGGAQGPVLRGNRTNSKSTFSGCYLLQTQPSGSRPFLDLQDGAYVTLVGCQVAPHPSTSVPIRVRRGASLVDIDCYYNYDGSPIVSEKGARRTSITAVTI